MEGICVYIFSWEGTYLALDRLMDIPEDVSLYDIEATFLGVRYEFWPHLSILRCTNLRKEFADESEDVARQKIAPSRYGSSFRTLPII